MFIPICTDTAFSPTWITVLPFRYQPELPVENDFTSASISWPLIEIFSCSAFSRNVVSETGHEVLGGIAGILHKTYGSLSASIGNFAVPVSVALKRLSRK